MKITRYLSRRSFFGAAGAAAAAGPLAVDAVAREIGGRGLGYSPVAGASSLSGGMQSPPSGASHVDRLRNALKNLQVEPFNILEVNRLDPDLVANRSLAFHTRLRIQAERDTIRRYAGRKASLLRQIAEEGGVI